MGICGTAPLPSFLILCAPHSAGRQSATAAVATKTSWRAASGSTASCICSALCTSMRVTWRGVGRCTGPATSVTIGAGLLRRTRDGKAHLAAGQVGDAAHRVDGLEGGPSGDQHALAGQTLWAGRRPPGPRTTRWLRACGHRRFRRRPGRPQPGPGSCCRRRAAAPDCAAWPDAPTSRGSLPAPAAAGSVRSAAPDTAGSATRRPGPCASLAMKSALAGATSTASASRVRLMCAMALGSRASHWLV